MADCGLQIEEQGHPSLDSVEQSQFAAVEDGYAYDAQLWNKANSACWIRMAVGGGRDARPAL